MRYVIAIDPGPERSGLCVIEEDTYKPILREKVLNDQLVDTVKCALGISTVVIEMVGHYGTGMPAGTDVFDTCVWIGRFLAQFDMRRVPTATLKRADVKMHLCGSMRANDATIRQALVDRFSPGSKNYGKGTKREPGWFYGFSADMWQAYALGVTYIDLGGKNE
jgi:hypothetical protein